MSEVENLHQNPKLFSFRKVREIIMNKLMLRLIIGENVRKERLARGISIDELADLLSLTSGFVGLIERGQRGATPSTLFKLSNVFGIPIDKFFYHTEDSLPSLVEIPSKQVKRERLNSLTSDFSDAEVDFIISVVKGLRSVNRSEVKATSIESSVEDPDVEDLDLDTE